MGIQELSPLLKKYGKELASGRDCELKGLRIGLDASVLMYQALNRGNSLHQWAVVPSIPVPEVIQYFSEFVEALRDAEVKEIVFVFDGARDPLKEEEHAKRQARRNESLKALDKIYDDPLPADQKSREEVLRAVGKHRKSCVYPRNDIILDVVTWCKTQGDITVVGAPFQADGQLIYLEKNGMWISKYIVYVDSNKY